MAQEVQGQLEGVYTNGCGCYCTRLRHVETGGIATERSKTDCIVKWRESGRRTKHYEAGEEARPDQMIKHSHNALLSAPRPRLILLDYT